MNAEGPLGRALITIVEIELDIPWLDFFNLIALFHYRRWFAARFLNIMVTKNLSLATVRSNNKKILFRKDGS